MRAVRTVLSTLGGLAAVALVGLSTLSLLVLGCPTELDDDDTVDPMEGLNVEDLGPFTVLEEYEPGGFFQLSVPADATSTTVVMGDVGDDLLTQWSILDPEAAVIWDTASDPNGYNVRCFATDDVHAWQHPTSPSEALREGTYQLEPYADGTPRDVDVTAIYRMGDPAGDQILDVTFHFVGVPGLDSSTVDSHGAFQSMLGHLDTLLFDAGIQLGDVAYEDVTSSVDELTLIESDAGPNSELGRLLAMSGDGIERRMHAFWVQGIDYGGMEVVGQAGSTPGPGVVQGTSHSGVALSAIDLEDKPEFTAVLVAHEFGHYMGLFHTIEKDGMAWDPLDDTPVCGSENDANGDNLLSPDECAGLGGDNLMFWTGTDASTVFTDDQGWVVGRSSLPY